MTINNYQILLSSDEARKALQENLSVYAYDLELATIGYDHIATCHLNEVKSSTIERLLNTSNIIYFIKNKE